MIRILIFLLFFPTFFCYCQTEDSTFNGLKVSHYNNGKIKSKIEYRNGKPNGFAQLFDSTGKIQESGYFINNRWVGNYTRYHNTGEVYMSFNFGADGKRVGLQKYYHKNGIIASIGFYVDGKENGPFIEFDSKGNKKGETVFYLNGKKSFVYVFRNGKDERGKKYSKTNIDEDWQAKEEIENSLIDFVNLENTILFRKNNFLKISSQLEIKNKEMQIAALENNNKKQEIELLNKNKELTNYQLEKVKKERELDKQEFEKEEILRNSAIDREKSQKMIFGGFASFILIVALMIFFNLQKNKKQNKVISLQKTEVEKQKQLVEEKQKEIVDSISYAKRLQEAILPPIEFVNTHLKDNFIYYQPKDIVAGDFYWAEKVGEKFFIAAADSTGHGVPGAMVSVVCSNALNRTIKEFNLTETGKILDKTRELVLETFEKSTNEVKDGMDISLLCIDSKNKNIFWSGANNPLWYIQDAELKEIKPDKQPIGKTDNPKPFTTHHIEYKENSTFYLFTDGLADQFGGPHGKKFKYKQLSDLLVKNNKQPQRKQAEIINKSFLEWKGELEQVDDICVIGIKI